MLIEASTSLALGTILTVLGSVAISISLQTSMSTVYTISFKKKVLSWAATFIALTIGISCLLTGLQESIQWLMQ